MQMQLVMCIYSKKTGLGVVIRNDYGSLIGAAMEPINGQLSVFAADGSSSYFDRFESLNKRRV